MLVVEVGLAVLHDQFISEELEGVGVAVAGCSQGRAGGGDQVRVLHAGGGELAIEAVDDLEGGVVGRGFGDSGVRPRRAQGRIPEIK